MSDLGMGGCMTPATWELNIDGLNYLGMPPRERMFDYTLPQFVMLPDGRIFQVVRWSETLPPTAEEVFQVSEPTLEILAAAEKNKPSPTARER